MTETSKVDALVKRLREAYDWTTVEPYSDRRTALEAADLLEQLAANIEALTAQLAEDADVRTQIDHRIEKLVAQVDALTARIQSVTTTGGWPELLTLWPVSDEYRAEAAEADNAAIREAALREASDSLLECSVWCDSQERTDDGWRNGVTDARKYHAAHILALINNTGDETK